MSEKFCGYESTQAAIKSGTEIEARAIQEFGTNNTGANPYVDTSL